ncbi:hypothetical protein V8F33_010282 [Rhypophila sp. PSN 637]
MACETPTSLTGHPETYGLGIRTSFYLLWFAIIAFNWLPPNLRGGFIALRIMHLVFSFAIFIGLASAISSSSSEPEQSRFQASEVYITLLVISSAIYFLVPLYLCRFLTCCLHCCGGSGCGTCSSGWGRTDYLLVRRNRSEKAGRGASSGDGTGGGFVAVLESIFLLLVAGLQCWFWWTGVVDPGLTLDDHDDDGCGTGYGFLFGKIELEDSHFRGFNSLVVLAVLSGAVVFSAVDTGVCGRGERNNRKRRRRRKRSASSFRARPRPSSA